MLCLWQSKSMTWFMYFQVLVWIFWSRQAVCKSQAADVLHISCWQAIGVIWLKRLSCAYLVRDHKSLTNGSIYRSQLLGRLQTRLQQQEQLSVTEAGLAISACAYIQDHNSNQVQYIIFAGKGHRRRLQYCEAEVWEWRLEIMKSSLWQQSFNRENCFCICRVTIVVIVRVHCKGGALWETRWQNAINMITNRQCNTLQMYYMCDAILWMLAHISIEHNYQEHKK